MTWASCLTWGKKNTNAFSPVKISLFAILLEQHHLNYLKQNASPFTKHLMPLTLSANCIDKTSSNLTMCRVLQIAKRPLPHRSNMRCRFFSCFMIYFSSSQFICSDLKYIVYVFMNAVEHYETPISSFISV